MAREGRDQDISVKPSAKKNLTNIINSNHHCPLGSPFGIGDQVELGFYIDRVHTAKLRNLLVSAFLEEFPHLLQHFREADIKSRNQYMYDVRRLAFSEVTLATQN
jgi:hypothetical protein